MLPLRGIVVHFLLLVSIICFGQDASFNIIHHGVEQGLGQSSANAMYQDHQDILWIGSFGGVSSFDGYEFQSYTHNPQDSLTISDNAVWSILEDTERNLWIGTKSGLSRFNRRTRTFENFYIVDSGSRRSTLAIKWLFETSDKRLLVGSEGKGVFEFDREIKSFKQVSIFPGDLKVSTISEDRNGDLIVGSENRGLFIYRRNTKIVDSFLELGLLQSRTIWSTFIDSKNTLWIGTDLEGIAFLSENSEKVEFLKDHHAQISPSKIQAIKQDGNGRLWIGSATDGLYIYNPENDNLQNFRSIHGTENSIQDNNVSQIVLGSNDNIFIGYYLNGFDKVTEVPFRTYKHNPLDPTSLSHDNVFSLYRDKQNNIWVGTFGGGLNLISDQKSGKFEHFLNDPDDPESISHNWVRVMYEDTRGNFWVGTWGGGLNLMDRKTGSFKRYLPNASAPDNSVSLNIITSLFEDSQGLLWIGTYGAGIDVLDPDREVFSHYSHDENDSKSLSDDHITSFFEDDEQNMWIATYGGGLNKLNKTTGEFTTYIPQPGNANSIADYKVLHLFQEPDEEHIWITTLGGGLNKFFPKRNEFQLYTTEDGLSNNNTLGMLRHKDGTYWISTNYGLSHFDPETEYFETFTTADGIGGIDFSLSAFAQDLAGTFYFGGGKGITLFNPDEVTPNVDFPKLMVHQVTIDGTPFNDIDNLTLNYKEQIAFDFAAVNPPKIERTFYAYRLIGLHDEWQTIGTRRHIEFATLLPGKYELEIRSTNGNDEWNSEYFSLAFLVDPPWYMRWWFRMGIILLVFSSAIGYYVKKTGQLKAQQILLEEKVSERTKTINEKNEALEEAYKRQKQLEDFKDSMVHMVAHDLKNPLVTILSGSSGKDDVDAMEQINRSGKDMLMLIENMLDIQKLQEATLVLDLTPFNLADMIKSTMDNLSIVSRHKQILLKSNVSKKIVVAADKALIERVISNLLTNAIKFSSVGQVVSVDGTVKDDQARICVSDNGKGIPKEKVAKLFEKYYQDEAKSYEGTRSFGLGLTFCKLALDGHGSQIEVVSEVGKGSSFIFYLPLHEQISDETIEEYPVQESEVSPIPPFLVKMPKEDILTLQGIPGIFSLDLYETGEWYQLLDQLNDLGSDSILTFAKELKVAIIHFDQDRLTEIRTLLEEKLDTISK